MLNNFIKFILTQRLMVIMAAAALSVAGVIAWRMLPIDAFPDVTNVQVMVLSDAPGLASVDVEQRVTFPVEKSLQGLPRVRQVRSMSKAGFSQVMCLQRMSTPTSLGNWSRTAAAAKEQSPRGFEPEMGPMQPGLGEDYQYTLESDSRTP